MKTKSPFYIFTALFILLSFMTLTSCQGVRSSKKVPVDYDVYEPSARLDEDGKPYELAISFDASVCKLEDLEKTPSQAITIAPPIAGDWFWKSDSSLVFTPAEPWQLNTKYKVTMPQEIFSPEVKVNNSFNFTTEKFSVYLENAEFYINPQNPAEKKVTATLSASHPMKKETVENCVKLVMEYNNKYGSVTDKKEKKFQLSFNKSATEAYIVSEALPIPQYSSNLKISLKGGIEAQIGGKSSIEDSTKIEIPGMSDYVKITDVSTTLIKNDEQNYDQTLIIETKGQVAVEELAKHLSIYQLPLQKPATEGWDASDSKGGFHWSTEYVTKDVMPLTEKVSFEVIPTAEPAASVNSFKYKALPGRYIYITLSGNIEFFGGYKLSFGADTENYQETLKVPNYPKELGILSEGSILSLSGSRKMALYSRGIEKVYYKLARIMPKDVNHLVSQSNGNMKNFSFSHSYYFNENNIAESEYSNQFIPNPSNEKISYFSYDFTSKLVPQSAKNLKNGLFIFQVAENEEAFRYSYSDYASDKRLILITDLGFIVKTSSNYTKDIFVQSIATGQPVPNAEVSIIGLNGNTLVSTTTDSTGHASLPDTPSTDFRNEHKPVAYLVKTANDLSFMPYSENGRSLDYSNYDIGGVVGSSKPEKITAYLFSDRGMYRPGDTVHMGLIAKAGNWDINLAGTPIEAEVKDSNGAVFYNTKLNLSASGFEEIEFATKDYSPTGNYTTSIYLLHEYKNRTEREFLTSVTIKVEEFMPDTLSISASFNPLPSNGWINPGALEGTVKLQNLFGTPAAGNDVKAQIYLTPGYPVSNRYSDYIFADPFLKDNSFEEFLGTKQTNENGEVAFDINVEKFEKATYRLQFYAEGFEKASGRSVSQTASVYVSPLKYLIGYKTDGRLDYINKNSKRKLSFIAVDQNLNKINLDNITVQTEEIRYISTLVKQPNGLYNYQSVKKLYPLTESKINISKQGTDYFVPSETAGEYKITLKDKDGLVFNTINYTIVGDKNTTRSLTRTAELEIKLEKSDLSAGETAQVFIKAPYAGSGLITVERDNVYTWKWFTASQGSSVQTIQIPRGLEGNGYINVMFTRAATSDEIFMSPFCYGAVPFSLNKEGRTNKITLDVPDEVKAGTDLTINYSSSDEGKIVIIAVDEGILQLAKYKTPDPISEFFKKRALEVQTSEILDLILPEYNILRSMAATGGGADMEMLAKNLNPFKRKQNAPVAYWSGVIESGSETRSVTYHVPDYFNGSMRIMAVAVSKSKIGATHKNILARNPIIISPNVPYVAAPNDEFDVSVTVTNNHKGTGDNKITLSAVSSKNLEIIGQKSASFTIKEGKDETTMFRVKAKDILGGAEIRFTASDATEKCSISSTLSVRPSMPYQIMINSGTGKSSAESNVDHALYDEYAVRNVAASNVPAAMLDGLKIYLEKYPYGCAEQVTSKAYPYLYSDFVKAAGKTHADAEKMVGDTIAILQSRMKNDGNIGYWTSNSPTQSFITLYCADFVTDAFNKGFYVPNAFRKKLIDRVKSIAASSNDDQQSIYLRSYAIFILTKNEIITTSYIERLEQDLNRKNFNPTGYEGLYLAASYAMLKMDKKADSILGKINMKKTFDSSWTYHNGLHYLATYIDVIAAYFPARLKNIKAAEIDELSNYLTSMAYYNTYANAAVIRAFEALVYTDKSDLYTAFEVNGKDSKQLSLKGDAVLKGEFSANAKKIQFKNESQMPLYWQTVQAGYEKNIPENAVRDGLEVTREYCAENGGKLGNIKTGDTVLVKISYRSTKGNLNNIALIDMCPAGLETDIQSVRDFASEKGDTDYVDIREDRIVIYTSVSEHINTFEYKAKAVNSGSFTVPPMFAESMYNKEIRAISPSKPITIAPAK